MQIEGQTAKVSFEESRELAKNKENLIQLIEIEGIIVNKAIMFLLLP